MSLQLGTYCPNFTLPNQKGELLTISDYIKTGIVVIYFYPKNNTKVCTEQACTFRDSMSQFNSLNITLIGISSDSVDSHNKFSSLYGLYFNLLSDERNEVKKLFKIYPTFLSFVPARVTFIFDHTGNLIAKYSDLFSAQNHLNFIKNAINKFTLT